MLEEQSGECSQIIPALGQGVGKRDDCPWRSMYCRDEGASSFYCKADRSSNSSITSLLTASSAGLSGGERQEEVQAVLYISPPPHRLTHNQEEGVQFVIFALYDLVPAPD